MKMRFFYKIDQKKEPILGSNVRRKSKPAGKEWREILDPCCTPYTVPCTCGPRYFIKLDNKGKPVDYSLIKRYKITPEEGLRYMEIPSSVNECCPSNIVGLAFTSAFPNDSLTVKVSGITIFAGTDSESTSVNFRNNDLVEITFVSGTGTNGSIQVEGSPDITGDTNLTALTGLNTYSFVAHVNNTYTITVTNL